jgi:hypothetical protein
MDELVMKGFHHLNPCNFYVLFDKIMFENKI